MGDAVCREPKVDLTLSICFKCYSPPPDGHALDRECLLSYIAALRREAPRMLQP